MDSSKEIPFRTLRRDPIRAPPSSVATEATIAHPLQRQIPARTALVQPTRNLDAVADVYGAHMAIRLCMEEEMLSHFGRLPGLQSSGLARDVLTGKVEEFDFDDWLGLPADAPLAGGAGTDVAVDLHYEMEKKLNIVPPRMV